MLLYLMRHGSAVDGSDASVRSDAERSLTDQGRTRVEQVARALEGLGAAPEVILTSPLVRAAQTAQMLARRFPTAKVRTSAHLSPGSDPSELVDEAAAARVQALACVGHSPHLEAVIARACAGVEFPICELKKAGVACLDLEVQSRRALLRWLLQPGQVRKLR
jgi:phosphohistidine phosphatase